MAILGQYFAASKGAKDLPSETFNPFEVWLYNQNAREEIDPNSAKIFLELSGENLIPAWAISAIDVKLIRAAADKKNGEQ